MVDKNEERSSFRTALSLKGLIARSLKCEKGKPQEYIETGTGIMHNRKEAWKTSDSPLSDQEKETRYNLLEEELN